MACTSLDHDYMKIHRQALVADLHCDTAMRMVEGFQISSPDSLAAIDLRKLKAGGVDLQVFACFEFTDTPPDKAVSTIDTMIDTLEAQFARNSNDIAICTTVGGARQIISKNKIAAFIGIENGVAINNDLANLEHFYSRGVRYMTLTHTSSNDWAISSADTSPAFYGLTDFGREVVRKMNELGMIIDVSHAASSTVEEVLKITNDPVIASHSCVYALCPSDRNLTDDQIKAIARNGGVIGINFFKGYLSRRWLEVDDSITTANQALIDSLKETFKDDYGQFRRALAPLYRERLAEVKVDVATVADHIDYIVKLVGPDYVGLGSDFDGVRSLPDGLTDCSLMPNITRELVERGYSQNDIDKILGGNFMRVFGKVCG